MILSRIYCGNRWELDEISWTLICCLMAPTPDKPLVKVFTPFAWQEIDHLDRHSKYYLPQTTPYTWGNNKLSKHWSIFIQYLIWRLKSRAEYLTSTFWVIHRMLSLYSANRTQTTVLNRQKFSFICSQIPYFWVPEQHRSHCCCVYSTSDRQSDFTATSEMPQVDNC